MVLAFILAVFFVIKTKAQTELNSIPQISIGIGYFGELLTHPGIVLFSEIALNKTKNQLVARINFIGYRHKGHTRNYFVLPEIIYRRNTKKLNYWEASLGTGLLYQLADSPVYKYRQGAFIKKKSGWFHFAPSFGIRYGKNFSLDNGDFLTPSIGGRMFYQYPFNDMWLLRTGFDLSVSYQIK